ncbi:MAG: hypothetical protein LBH91_09480 [Prevotellaceae bacterium]|jgi:hypothetical protein|nr:hypothetical protein [Prevotellaceae bacterium]
METKTSHPLWALACKRKGTELRLLNGRYYLYEVTSKWNPEKKRSVSRFTSYELQNLPYTFHYSLFIIH